MDHPKFIVLDRRKKPLVHKGMTTVHVFSNDIFSSILIVVKVLHFYI